MKVCGYCCFFQAEDGIRYLVRSRGLGDVYKRQEISQMPPYRQGKESIGPLDSAGGGHTAKPALEELSLIHI